jgi:DNA repair exonuclease SbcCD ATPase subunit
MKKYLGVMSNLVNEFIGDLVDFRFEIFNDESKIKMNIIKSNNERYPICSGFERFICNIGLKYAFRKISKNSCGKIFFLDEGMDCIDEDNFKNIGIILKKLQSLFDNIFVITHINDIKNYIDEEINIGKENNSSFIIN